MLIFIDKKFNYNEWIRIDASVFLHSPETLVFSYYVGRDENLRFTKLNPDENCLISGLTKLVGKGVTVSTFIHIFLQIKKCFCKTLAGKNHYDLENIKVDLKNYYKNGCNLNSTFLKHGIEDSEFFASIKEIVTSKLSNDHIRLNSFSQSIIFVSHNGLSPLVTKISTLNKYSQNFKH